MDTKTDQSTAPAAQPAEAEEATAEGVPSAAPDRQGPIDKTPGGTAPAATPRGATPGVLPGAAAVVGAGLALASLTGTWLGTMLQERAQLTGQIKAQSGAAADQIATVYGTPWHTTALVNGLFALAAVVIAGVVLVRRRLAPATAPWVTAVAWGAVALGVIGLLIAAAMGLDVFTSLPKVPSSPVGGGPAG